MRVILLDFGSSVMKKSCRFKFNEFSYPSMNLIIRSSYMRYICLIVFLIVIIRLNIKIALKRVEVLILTNTSFYRIKNIISPEKS